MQDPAILQRIEIIESFALQIGLAENRIAEIEDELQYIFNRFVVRFESEVSSDTLLRGKAFVMMREDDEAEALRLELHDLKSSLVDLRATAERQRWEIADELIARIPAPAGVVSFGKWN